MKYILVLLAIIATGIGLLSLREAKDEEETPLTQELTLVDSISHAHGLAVDVADSSKLYIATHYVLYVLMNEK